MNERLIILSDLCFEPDHTHNVLKVSSPLFLKTFLLRPENISGDAKAIKCIAALWSNAGKKKVPLEVRTFFG